MSVFSPLLAVLAMLIVVSAAPLDDNHVGISPALVPEAAGERPHRERQQHKRHETDRTTTESFSHVAVVSKRCAVLGPMMPG